MTSITTTYDFDQMINRRGTGAAKYDAFDDPEILPMWVADMDFPSPREVIDALHERVDHRIFGYMMGSPRLTEILVQRMGERYNWDIKPEDILYLPGVVSGFNNAIRAVGQPGDNFLIQTPVYPPFLMATGGNGQSYKAAELRRVRKGSRLDYKINFDAFEQAIDEHTRMFLLCSPHNPIGRVWRRSELSRLAEICEKHDLVICSDEIHCDLIMSGHRHVPIASLDPEIARRTITLMAPSKTFNVPSLGFAFAIIQDKDLRKKFQAAESGVVSHPGVLGFTAALAAYQFGDVWLREVLRYLEANRDFTTQFIERNLPGVPVTHPEGTYLSWMDCRQFVPQDTDTEGFSAWIEPFFLKKARVALNSGTLFGESGKGYARLNFATPRALLEKGLNRMRDAVQRTEARA